MQQNSKFSRTSRTKTCCTCCSRFYLGHVGLQHLRVPGAVGPQFRVKAGGDVLRGGVLSLSVAGCDLRVPVRDQNVVPVDVLVVHAGGTVPQVVEDVDVVENAVVAVGSAENHLGVTAARLEVSRRHPHVPRRLLPPPVGPLPDGVQAGGQVREAVAGLQRPEPHHGPEDEEREEEEGDQSLPAQPRHGRCLRCCCSRGQRGDAAAPHSRLRAPSVALQHELARSEEQEPRMQERSRPPDGYVASSAATARSSGTDIRSGIFLQNSQDPTAPAHELHPFVGENDVFFSLKSRRSAEEEGGASRRCHHSDISNKFNFTIINYFFLF